MSCNLRVKKFKDDSAALGPILADQFLFSLGNDRDLYQEIQHPKRGGLKMDELIDRFISANSSPISANKVRKLLKRNVGSIRLIVNSLLLGDAQISAVVNKSKSTLDKAAVLLDVRDRPLVLDGVVDNNLSLEAIQVEQDNLITEVEECITSIHKLIHCIAKAGNLAKTLLPLQDELQQPCLYTRERSSGEGNDDNEDNCHLIMDKLDRLELELTEVSNKLWQEVAHF